MPLAGPEPDPMAECGARKAALPGPHDLVPGLRIMLAIPVAAEMDHKPYRIAQAVG